MTALAEWFNQSEWNQVKGLIPASPLAESVGATTLHIMTLVMKTLNNQFNSGITTLSVTTIGITTLNITTFSIETSSMITLSIKTLSKTTVTLTTHNSKNVLQSAAI